MESNRASKDACRACVWSTAYQQYTPQKKEMTLTDVSCNWTLVVPVFGGKPGTSGVILGVLSFSAGGWVLLGEQSMFARSAICRSFWRCLSVNSAFRILTCSAWTLIVRSKTMRATSKKFATTYNGPIQHTSTLQHRESTSTNSPQHWEILLSYALTQSLRGIRCLFELANTRSFTTWVFILTFQHITSPFKGASRI